MKNKNYEFFAEICKNETENYISEKLLEEGVTVEICSVTKVNETLTAMTFRIPDSDVSPNVYVENLYEEFEERFGFSEDEERDRYLIVHFLRGIVKKLFCKPFPKAFFAENFTNKDTVRDRVFYQLINKNMNEDLLENAPYKEITGDLVIVYRLLAQLGDEEGSVASALITNQLAEFFALSEEKLYELAKENTPKLFPPRMSSLLDIIANMGKPAERELTDAEICEILLSKEMPPLLHVSNEYNLHGAGVILYDGFLSRIAQAVKTDLIIIPSSIHEVLVFPCFSEEDIVACSTMVPEVNETMVIPGELLSDFVFVYKREETSLCSYGPEDVKNLLGKMGFDS